MKKLTKIIIKPDKYPWQVWIRNRITLYEGIDFFHLDKMITFYKTPPEGEYDYFYE